ncbi:DnaJ domain-containing protein [Providencia hangzhouensis]
MNIQEALNIFGLSGELTEDDIKKAYKKAALKYHPDRNPLGAELMKAVNSAYNFLIENIDKINKFQSDNKENHYNFSEKLESVLTVLSGLNGIAYEIIGNWIWISGETKQHKDILKENKCIWARKKEDMTLWFYRPVEHKSRRKAKESTMDEMRETYGTSGRRQAKGQYQIENRC